MDMIIAIGLLISGFLMTLIGFEIIKLKVKNPEDLERMIIWRKKFGKFFKIGGIAVLIIGIFLIIDPHSKKEPKEWTQAQKIEMKKQILKSSNFLKSIPRNLQLKNPGSKIK